MANDGDGWIRGVDLLSWSVLMLGVGVRLCAWITQQLARFWVSIYEMYRRIKRIVQEDQTDREPEE